MLLLVILFAIKLLAQVKIFKYSFLCHKIMLFVIYLALQKIYFLHWLIDESVCSFVYYKIWE